MATMDHTQRRSSNSHAALEDRFEVIKEIGDGSFGSVALARVRAAGSQIARRGTMVAIKTMKKNFDSFAPCLELREVIFLKTLPTHIHLVPALDIFLDPYTRKLHICMEYMDGNLYQLMKARDHKCLDSKSVKSILFQILLGLDHIHAHNFFHRDIKPENILVSTSAPNDSSSAFSRYSALVTPPSTPPTYSIKIADFGLARETQSKLPYTTYVSTRWYRAPEVLLRAGEYSAPVDIWALGAMAVEVANLKPLFPGGNEVDQVWRVCEIMGSPGNWYNKSGARIGGGDWREGTKLAQKLGFSFPKMAPHSMETILQPPQWPIAFSNFVTWCLMWDPKNRPTTRQALDHEFFADAVDPLLPKSSASRLLGRKHSDLSFKSSKDKENHESPVVTSKPSWFRRSLIGRESAPAVPQHDPHAKPLQGSTIPELGIGIKKSRPVVNKRATWTNGMIPAVGAPMPILPSIRPVSPLSHAVTAQASSRVTHGETRTDGGSGQINEKPSKIGRQLSLNSRNSQYIDLHRQDAEQNLTGSNPLVSPTSGQKESFFSHLRKRARRFSGRHGLASPSGEDVEANAAVRQWSNRSSMVIDNFSPEKSGRNGFMELDKALHSIRYGSDVSKSQVAINSTSSPLKRQHSTPKAAPTKSMENLSSNPAPVSARTRRALQMVSHPVHHYETPEEEDELLDEVLMSTNRAVKRLDQHYQLDDSNEQTTLTQKEGHRQSLSLLSANLSQGNPYPTPSPSAKRNGVLFSSEAVSLSQPLTINKPRHDNQHVDSHWPTPPYEENEWAAAAAASIFAAGSIYE